MKIPFAVACCFAVLLAATPAVSPAQDSPGFFASTDSTPAAFTQAELDQMLAPIALYPDTLLTQVLAASTYPLEVVSLQRWLDGHRGLSGDALDAALAGEPWDASVKALARFGDVVAMMNEHLEWMQSLGNAFLEQEGEVMDAVQRLREKARDAGTLGNNPRERIVTEDDGVIVIEPAVSGVVYVPAYDARVVYGPWGWPAYPPYYWSVPVLYGEYFGSFAFGFGIAIGNAWHDHPRFDWHRHRVIAGRHDRPDAWRHNPAHRGAVPYPRGARPGLAASDVNRRHQDFRGFEPRPRPATPSPSVNPAAREPARPATPSLHARSPLTPEARDVARAQSERGRASLGALPPRPASRFAHTAPPPAARAPAPAPAPRAMPSSPRPRDNPAQRNPAARP